jgi:hypothetical protein
MQWGPHTTDTASLRHNQLHHHTTATNISRYFLYEINTEITAATVSVLTFPHEAQYKVTNINIYSKLL